MCAVEMSSPCDLDTASRSAPTILSSRYGSITRQATPVFKGHSKSDSSVPGNGDLWSTVSSNKVFAFVNPGYSSPASVRRGLGNLDTSQTVREADTENGKSGGKAGARSCDNLVTPNTMPSSKHLKMLPKSSSLLYVRPQVYIKLVRARGASCEQILQQEDTGSSDKTMDAGKPNRESMRTSVSDASQQSQGYLRKIRSLFKRKSRTNLNNQISKSSENVSPQISETDDTDLHMTLSHLSASDSSSDSSSDVAANARIMQKMQTLRNLIKDEEAKETTETKAEALIKYGDKNGSKEGIQTADTVDNLKLVYTPQNNQEPERRMSQMRTNSDQIDSSQANITQTPNLNRRKVCLELHYNLTTTLPASMTDEIHVVKDACHVLPLDNGEVVVTDNLSSQIVLFDVHGNPKITFTLEYGSEPWATCMTSEGYLAITLKRQGCVSLWSTSGEPVSEFGHNVLFDPTGIVCDQQGRFFVTDEQANSVCVFNKVGQFVAKLHVSEKDADVEGKEDKPTSRPFFHQPRYICITNAGNYVIADSGNQCLKIFDPDMHFQHHFGRYGSGDGCFKFPYGVASDEDNNLYVADYYNNRVTLFSPQGEFIDHILTPQDGITRPKSIAIKHSFLYVTHGGLRSNKVAVYKLRKRL